MAVKIYCHTSVGFNPYQNLALEEALAQKTAEDKAVALYLWQNHDTVVIGKHQNAYAECDYKAMQADNISLARRKTGGGAVFHDKNNLNFTFINIPHDYDIERNRRIICRAMESLGVDCEISGRNDITWQGKKFSGNAFFRGKDYCVHHGTIMVDVDMDKLQKYLSVDSSKLISKGVSSVKARVINLKSVNGDISVDKIKMALKQAFELEYGGKALPIDISKLQEKINALARFYADKRFILGDYPEIIKRQRKDYGELMIAREKGKLTLHSDCLDTEVIDYIKERLRGGAKSILPRKDFGSERLTIIEDINKMLAEEQI